MLIMRIGLDQIGRKGISMDRDHLKYNLREIQKHKGMPFQMANEELADEQFPYIKAEFPEAVMVKCDIDQYIVVTKRARTVLIKRLMASKAKHENDIVEIEKAVNKLQDGDCT